MTKKIIVFLLFAISIMAQTITWNETTQDYNLPDGIRTFSGSRNNPKLNIWYIEVDLNNQDLAVRPYLSSDKMIVPDFLKKTDAIAAVNGGYFGGSTSYSAVVYPGEVKAMNVTSLTRNNMSYPVMRSFFGFNSDRSLSMEWIYHFGNTVKDIYKFDSPMDYSFEDPNPEPAPQKSAGSQMENLMTGIGGGPRLIRNNEIDITYNEEIFWGSGVGLSNGDPRTAVGFTSDNKVIMIVADGRQAASDGVSLTEMASILKDLGCVEAMNLDGGGSSQMAIDNQYINNPSEQRPVPTILAVIYSDSLGLPKTPVYEKIIDTEDNEANAVGSGWFPTANPGYYGSSPSLLHSLGSGDNAYEYNFNLNKSKVEYEVYGWWVASDNRCKNTPFIIHHAGSVDTVTVDQTKNGSNWFLIGKYQFDGSDGEKLVISDAGSAGNYVVADAIKILTYDKNVLTDLTDNSTTPAEFIIYNNYPNPFNPSTKIGFEISSPAHIKLKIFDQLGRLVQSVMEGPLNAGKHEFTFKAENLSSGIYFYTIESDAFSATKPMMLLK